LSRAESSKLEFMCNDELARDSKRKSCFDDSSALTERAPSTRFRARLSKLPAVAGTEKDMSDVAGTEKDASSTCVSSATAAPAKCLLPPGDVPGGTIPGRRHRSSCREDALTMARRKASMLSSPGRAIGRVAKAAEGRSALSSTKGVARGPGEEDRVPRKTTAALEAELQDKDSQMTAVEDELVKVRARGREMSIDTMLRASSQLTGSRSRANLAGAAPPRPPGVTSPLISQWLPHSPRSVAPGGGEASASTLEHADSCHRSDPLGGCSSTHEPIRTSKCLPHSTKLPRPSVPTLEAHLADHEESTLCVSTDAPSGTVLDDRISETSGQPLAALQPAPSELQKLSNGCMRSQKVRV